ncbi:MAG: signal peptidase [Verrucomicrobiota bacterium]|jgi:signal peptidase I
MGMNNSAEFTKPDSNADQSKAAAIQAKALKDVKATPKQQVVQLICALLVAGASYFVATHYVFQTVIVDGDSMNPTLRNLQSFVMNRVELYFREPQWGDIVVIKDPEDGGLSIKRIVAVAGQTVQLTGGAVMVNGLRLKENYLRPGTKTFSYRVYDGEKFDCAKGQFFVLGDNRGNSADSRVYGPVPRANILGVVVP